MQSVWCMRYEANVRNTTVWNFTAIFDCIKRLMFCVRIAVRLKAKKRKIMRPMAQEVIRVVCRMVTLLEAMKTTPCALRSGQTEQINSLVPFADGLWRW